MNFIKKYCLNWRLRRFVGGKKRVEKNVFSLQEARSLCFFITYDNPNQLEELTQYVAKYDDKKIAVICYLPDEKTVENITVPPFLHTVSSKDVGLTGRIKKQALKTIFSQQYTIFIDMNTKTDLTSLYLQTLPKADFRIGGSQERYNYFDFTFCAGEQCSIKNYLCNLEIYTSKLKGY